MIRGIFRIAIDPGANGGIAWPNGSGGYHAAAMTPTLPEVAMQLRQIITEGRSSGGPVEAHLEQVGGYVGGEGGPGSAMFNFGENYGFIQGFLAGLEVPLIRWPPQRWQKALNMGTKEPAPKLAPDATAENRAQHRRLLAKIKRDWKNKLKAEAGRRNPSIKVTLDTADALLILAAADLTEDKPGSMPPRRNR